MSILERARTRGIGKKRSEARFGVGAIVPAAFLLTMFLIIPTLLAFGLSFTNARLVSPNAPEFTGITNFQRLLGISVEEVDALTDNNGNLVLEEGELVFPSARDLQADKEPNRKQSEFSSWVSEDGLTKTYLLTGEPLFWKSLWNTLSFMLVVVPVQAGLGLLLALFVNQKMLLANLYRTVIFIPVVTSMVVVSILWVFMYEENGLFNFFLGNIIPGYEPIAWLRNEATALPAIIIMSVWQGVGFHMIIWLSGLQTIPGELYEAAKIDGAGRLQRFANVTWPGLRNTFIFVLITITIAALGLFTQINVMTQGGPLDATTTLVFQAFTVGYGKQQMGYGATIAIVFFVIVLLISIIQRRLTRDQD